MIADWSKLNTLTTPVGNLTLNAATGDRYLALNDRCDAGADLRVTFDNIPQFDGQLNHTQYLTGYKMRLAFALWTGPDDGGAAACGGDAQEMLDELGAHIDALRNPTGTTRIIWTPENLASRMVNEINLMEKAVVTTDTSSSEAIVIVSFGVVSPFPYEMSESEQTPSTIADGATETLVNAGSTRFWPVFRVNGSTSSFSIVNNTTGERIDYDGATIPGGSYVEIDCFTGQAFLNGSSTDELDGINFLTTDFFTLVRGDNDVSIDGASTTVLWNNAWL